MAKKKKAKVVQLLSPENYIRKKSRTLPIHECWVNDNWEYTKSAHIFISRKHSNEKFSVGIFLVDLLCLGIKDTHFQFNIFDSQFKELLEMAGEELDFVKMDYKIAHNIIFAGLEFAEDYGFEPHKNFTATTQYFLEEDNDDIELIEIECGENDKPMYVMGPFDTDADVKRITAQLEKTAGKGNYTIIDQDEDSYDDEDYWGDNDEELEEKINEQEECLGKLSQSEKIILIQSLILRMEDLSEEEKDDVGYLSFSITEQYIDFDKADEICEHLVYEIDEFEITESPSDELLGLEYLNPETDQAEWKKTYTEIFSLITSKPKKAKRKIKKLKKEMPANPSLAYLELMLLEVEKTNEFEEILTNYHKQFSNFPVINIMWTVHLLKTDRKESVNIHLQQGPAAFFKNRKNWHGSELNQYLFMLVFYSAVNQDMTLLHSLDLVNDEVQSFQSLNFYSEILSEFITLVKMQFIMNLKP